MKILRTVKYSDHYIAYIKSKYPNFDCISYDAQCEIFSEEYYGWGNTWDRVLSSLDGVYCKTLVVNLFGHTEKFAGNGSHLNQVLMAINKIEADVLLVFDKGFSESELNYLRMRAPSLKKICKWIGLGIASVEVGNGYDIIITCLRANQNFYKNKGYECYYFPSYCDVEILKNINRTQSTKIIFCGSVNSFEGAHYRRAEILYKLAMKYPVEYHISEIDIKNIIKLGLRLLLNILKLSKGSFQKIKYFWYFIYLFKVNHKPLYGKAYFNAITSAGLAVNIDIDSAGEESGNLRLYECLTLGARLITDYKKNIEHLFDNESLFSFTSIDDICKVIDSLPKFWSPHFLYKNKLLEKEIKSFYLYLIKFSR